MQIRPFRDSDTKAVIALWDRCGLLRPWNDPVADIRLAQRTDSAEIFIGKDDDTVVAAIMCGHDGHRAWLYYVAVDPDCQRQGFGSLLVTHAEDWLRGLGAPKLELMIRDTNVEMVQFYSSLGYRTEPVVTMSRWLKQPPEAPDD